MDGLLAAPLIHHLRFDVDLTHLKVTINGGLESEYCLDTGSASAAASTQLVSAGVGAGFDGGLCVELPTHLSEMLSDLTGGCKTPEDKTCKPFSCSV
jgi:hypothetical protein